VIGPGGVGGCAIREIARLPEYELAGVLAYSPAKDGCDAGEIVGIAPLGVTVTVDFEKFVATPGLDCVLHCGRDFGDWRADSEIIRLLERGVDVITMLPYHYLPARGEEVAARFRNAAAKGGATLHGSGITPGFFNERMAMLATGLSNDVQHIHFAEYINIWPLAGQLQMLQMFGFGAQREAVEANQAAAQLAENYLTQPIHFIADRLGIAIDRIERTANLATSPVKIEAPVMTVEAGMVGMVSYAWTAYAKGKPFYTTEVFWYLGDAMRPERCRGANDFWTIDIEGRPSYAIEIAAKASLVRDSYIEPGEPVPPSYIATVVAMLQSVPAVTAAPPGLMLPALPQFHWKPDQRLGTAVAA
jgi:4-hydroxy-tetrahydrodipicolinate reductase